MRLFRFCSQLALGLLLAGHALASVEKDFLAAREAYGKGRNDQFARLADRIPAQHPLKVYLDYWRLKNGPVATDTLLAFADANPDTPLSERALQEAARFHGKNENWAGFRQIAGRLVRQDNELRCFGLRARLDQNEPGAATEALALWRTAQDLPSSCAPLFATLSVRGLLTIDNRLDRLRLALEAGNLGLARDLIASLPENDRATAELLGQAQRAPQTVLDATVSSETQREVQLYALAQLAKSDPGRAAVLWEARVANLPEATARHGWGIVAMAAARQLKPEAVAWFQRAQTELSDNQRTWRIRAMLRAGRWLDVYQGILGLPTESQNEAVWRYWKARALRALNAGYQANQLFAQLSREPHYYGLLAYEELPVRLETRADEYRPTPDRIEAAKAHPGLNRALLLRKLDLNVDAVAEWDWALRGMRDEDILAAAELARQAQWYDRAILTAEKTRTIHSFDLRYLTPYRDLAEAHASQNSLDPAWVYGLMRQESRFVDYARSQVGAQGLMQIMPATAKWIARQMGLDKKAHAKVGEPEANIRFGTFYLKRLYDDLNGSAVLATAGYNAGPGRARRWQADTPLEGAVYTETIPFTETREYVKKVLANAMHYSRLLGTPSKPLKERLGTIPPRATTVAATGLTDPQP